MKHRAPIGSQPPARPSAVAALLFALATVALAMVLLAPGSLAKPAKKEPGRTEEARLRRAAQLSGLALADMEEANYGQAVERLGELQELLPDNLLPPVNLAICHLKLGETEAALTAIERAFSLRPDNPQVLYTLAKVLELVPELKERRERILDRFEQAHPTDPRPHYLRARTLETERQTGAALPHLEAALQRAEENLVLLVDRLVAAAFAGEAEATADALDAIEDRLDGFTDSLADYAETLRDTVDTLSASLDSDGTATVDPAALRPPALVIRNLLRPSELYQLDLLPLTGGQQHSGALFPQQSFDPPLPKSIQGGQDIAIRFVDATAKSGLADLPAGELRLTALHQPDAEERWVVVTRRGSRLLHWHGGRFEEQRLAARPSFGDDLSAYDFDQDGLADLMFANRGEVWMAVGNAERGFAEPRLLFKTKPEGEAPASHEGSLKLFPVDIDHDGDLDLFVARAGRPDLYLQNQGGGPWVERALELGIAGTAQTTSDTVVADFDDDGDLDLLSVTPEGHPRLYDNRRTGTFREASEAAELAALSQQGLSAAELLDFDRDGLFDLLLWGPGGALLLRNQGGRFTPVPLPLAGLRWSAAAVGDFDNDGDPDLVAVVGDSESNDSKTGDGEGGAAVFLRNRRDRWVVEEMGLHLTEISTLTAGDFDDDGDLDLLAQNSIGRPRLWRNEGGNRNHWLRLALLGKGDNNSKNNTQGLFTRIEVRADGELQTLSGNGAINHIGLGASRLADVVRVVWSNGLSQTWQRLSADRTLVEEQVLKGSCPFLYTFDGEGFAFVTDLMWRSPLGMVLPDGSAAPHQPAQDWVRIRGEALRPAGGKLWLQVTEELWEAAYIDRQFLLAVDHPATTELLVDERFTPPPYPSQPPIHLIGERLQPVSATDQRGRDVLAKILHRDGVHVDGLPLDRYQGVTHGHSLTLTFADVPAAGRLRLLLAGWIFPTDSSINFALAQDSTRDSRPPSLELRQADGSWRRLEGSIGFPNGKRKSLVIDLTDRLPAGRVTLRLATTMQIYWDSAALALGDPAANDPTTGATRAPRMTRLEPQYSELHQRGFSRLYRESATGPHLFDYRQVSLDSPFRPMIGEATAAGEVTPLLAASDDRYAILIAGHEMTVTYDATLLPPLADGHRRDYVLYTDGWVKDADIHTAHSQTIGPLPHHGMTEYR